jgi:hypothetical protein
MEEFHHAKERDLNIHIKKMHTHMRETELKEEEEVKQREESLIKWEK